MPLTNAEKQQRYRERLKNNPEKKEEIRQKNLERIKRKTKKVQDLTEEEKHEKRQQWRKQKQKQKEKKIAAMRNEKKEKQTNNPKFTVRLKKLRINYKKSLATIQKLHKVITTLRKRNYRQKILLGAKIEEKCKEIDKLNCRIEVTESMIKTIYKSSTSLKKRLIKKVSLNETRQHNINSKGFVAKCLGIARVRKYRKVGQKKSEKIFEEISKFYIRDDISRITAGKKECRTKHKDKQQIRYLTDTLRNLYKIYKSEGGEQSFTTFYKYKPFFVLSPTGSSRETCLCIKHSNMNYLLKALIFNKLIDRGTILKDILSRITCDITSFDCMHGKCRDCVNSVIEFNADDSRKNELTNWWWWQSEKHSYTKKDKNSGEDKEMQTRKTTKQVKKGTLKELIQTFNKEIKLFKKHYFNMKTQQKQYRACMEQLKSHEVLMICDYSENYNTKLSEEIQSMHFGASKQQVTLHCVMVYWKDKCQSLCTVSESPCHEPAAIWAHLLPVIKFIRESTPNTTVLHVYSDGPTSQYRQKKNYFLLNMFAQKMNFDYGTWSYTESGHGKGVADGIGGAVKRCLDRQVLYGHDLRNADDVFINIDAAMKSVKPFLIPVQDIENMKKIIPPNLRPLFGNNEVHQIITTGEENVILHRPLSCFCGSKPGLCSCYHPKRHCLLHVPVAQHVTVRVQDQDISEVFTGDNLHTLETASQHSQNGCIKKQPEVNVVVPNENSIIIEVTRTPDMTVRDEDIPEVITGEDIPLQAASLYSHDESVKPLFQEKTVPDDLPTFNTKLTPPDVTVRDEDIHEVITGEDISLKAASLYSHDEGVKPLFQDKGVPDELPSFNTKLTPPECYCDEVMVLDEENAYPKKLDTNLNENTALIVPTGIKRKTRNTDIVLKKVKVLMPTNMPFSCENEQNRSKSDTKLKILENIKIVPASKPSSSEIKGFRSKSLKTIVTRFFICSLCDRRKLFTKIETAVCMVCKNRVCKDCSGHEAGLNYICNKCLE